MRISKEDMEYLDRCPDLKAGRLRCLARRRSAERKLAALPKRGGSKDVQLERWSAKHALRANVPEVYVEAARLRCGGKSYLWSMEPSNAYS